MKNKSLNLTRTFIGCIVLFAAMIYTSYLAHKLLHTFIDAFNPEQLQTNSFISWGGALILCGVVLFYGLSQNENKFGNTSFYLAFIMVAFDFAAYYKGLKITNYSYDSLAPAVILSIVIPFLIHFVSHDISMLVWGEEEEVENNVIEPQIIEQVINDKDVKIIPQRTPKPLLGSNKLGTSNMVMCANPRCTYLSDKNLYPMRKTCRDSCKTQASVARRKNKDINE